MNDSLVYGGAAVIIALMAVVIFKVKRSPKMQAVEPESQKAKDALEGLRQTVASPPPGLPPSEIQGANAGIKSLEEFPIGQKLGFEITRIKEGTHKRITIAKGQIGIKADRFGRMPNILFFEWGKPDKVKGGGLYWVNAKKIISVVEPNGKTVYKLVYDLLVSEPLNQDGTVAWDDDLSTVLADSTIDQYVVIAAWEGGFSFSPTLKRVMVLVAFLGFVIGLAINGSIHVVPTTIIHWIP